MTPEERADRLVIQADQLRRVAEQLEAQAAGLRPERTPLNHRKVFALVFDRRKTSVELWDSWDGSPHAGCAYCCFPVHAHDAGHIEVFWDQLSATACSTTDDGTVSRCAEIDHVLPLSRGGTNELANLTIACRTCNRDKGARTPSEWALDLAVKAFAEVEIPCQPEFAVTVLRLLAEAVRTGELWPNAVAGYAAFRDLRRQWCPPAGAMEWSA